MNGSGSGSSGSGSSDWPEVIGGVPGKFGQIITEPGFGLVVGEQVDRFLARQETLGRRTARSHRSIIGGGGGVQSVFMLQNTTSALGVHLIFALTVLLTCANGIDLVKQGTTIPFTMRCKRWTWNTANGTRLPDQWRPVHPAGHSPPGSAAGFQSTGKFHRSAR